LTTRVISIPTTYWLEFPGKWDPKSPWHERRVRLAANYAIDRQAIMESETLGFGKLANVPQ
jgi:peptide/nickel transport system substrate-binding protein